MRGSTGFVSVFTAIEGGCLSFAPNATICDPSSFFENNSLAANCLSDTQILRGSAFLFTNIWLDDVLQRMLNPSS
jgi:hypothetical protein